MPATVQEVTPRKGQAGGRRRQAGHDGDGQRALQGEQRAVLVQLRLDAVYAQMADIAFAARRVQHDEQAVLAFGHHDVVDDAAQLVGQQGVALAARCQAHDVAGRQLLQRGGGVLPVQRDLAHVGDVEQAGVGARMGVFGERAGELHRQRPAGEIDHAPAQATVQRVQRRGARGRGGITVWQVGHSVWFRAHEVRSGRPAV